MYRLCGGGEKQEVDGSSAEMSWVQLRYGKDKTPEECVSVPRNLMPAGKSYTHTHTPLELAEKCESAS